MADGRISQSYREANLVHHYAEETHVHEGPKIAQGKVAPPSFGRSGKSWQSRTEVIEREHRRAGQHDAERCQSRGWQRPQANFRGDEVNCPNEDDESDRCAKDNAAWHSSAGGIDSHRSGYSFFSHGKLVDAVETWFESDAGTGGHAYRTLRGDRDFRKDNILFPIAFAGGHIAGAAEN